MKLVLLTTPGGKKYALQLAVEISLRGVPINAIVESAAPPRQLKLYHKLRRAWRLWLAHRIEFDRLLPKYDLPPFTENLIAVDNYESEQTLATLRSLSPEYFLLGGVGILKKPLLDIPSRGVLNAHPGLLPWMRGTGVVARAIENNYPVGATLHFVDPGIDTGSIIERRLVPIIPNDNLDAIEARADLLSIKMLADACAAIHQGRPPAGHTQKEKYPYNKWASPGEREAIKKLVSAGKAMELYTSWLDKDLSKP